MQNTGVGKKNPSILIFYCGKLRNKSTILCSPSDHGGIFLHCWILTGFGTSSEQENVAEVTLCRVRNLCFLEPWGHHGLEKPRMKCTMERKPHAERAPDSLAVPGTSTETPEMWLGSPGRSPAGWMLPCERLQQEQSQNCSQLRVERYNNPVLF